jgi:hypothetical protein
MQKAGSYIYIYIGASSAVSCTLVRPLPEGRCNRGIHNWFTADHLYVCIHRLDRSRLLGTRHGGRRGVSRENATVTLLAVVIVAGARWLGVRLSTIGGRFGRHVDRMDGWLSRDVVVQPASGRGRSCVRRETVLSERRRRRRQRLLLSLRRSEAYECCGSCAVRRYIYAADWRRGGRTKVVVPRERFVCGLPCRPRTMTNRNDLI